MFGLSLKSRAKKILKKDFQYPIVNSVQSLTLHGVIERAKSLSLNEYDAAIMFMLIQMNALSPSDPRVTSFVDRHSQNIKGLISLAASPSTEILEMVREIKSRHRLSVGNEGQTKRIIEPMTDLLIAQKKQFADEGGVLPKKAKDNWSIGYVGGYADALLNNAGIDTDVKGLSIMTGIFISVFGKNEAPVLFSKFLNLQSEQDLDFFDGRKNGGEELIALLESSKNVARGWSIHVGVSKKDKAHAPKSTTPASFEFRERVSKGERKTIRTYGSSMEYVCEYCGYITEQPDSHMGQCGYCQRIGVVT